ncbi:WD domain, G-beta repeat protein [Cooperia oncophora]
MHGHRSDIRGLSVSSSNNAIVSGGGNELMIWNTHSLRPVASLQNEAMEDVMAVIFTQGDGHVVAATKLMIWNTHSLRPVASLQNEAMEDVMAVIFTQGDGHVVAATKTGELFLWDVAGCELLESRKGHERTIWGLAHSPDGKQLLSVSSDKRAIFWAYEVAAEGTRKRLTLRENRILEVPDEALCCAFSPDGKFVVIGLLDNTAAVYFYDTLKFFISLYGHSLPVTCVTVSPNSKLVVTGSADKSIKIWGLDFGDCHKSFHAHDDVVSAVMFSPSDEMLVWSAGKDGKIKQWDAQKMCQVQVCERAVSIAAF